MINRNLPIKVVYHGGQDKINSISESSIEMVAKLKKCIMWIVTNLIRASDTMLGNKA